MTYFDLNILWGLTLMFSTGFIHKCEPFMKALQYFFESRNSELETTTPRAWQLACYRYRPLVVAQMYQIRVFSGFCSTNSVFIHHSESKMAWQHSYSSDRVRTFEPDVPGRLPSSICYILLLVPADLAVVIFAVQRVQLFLTNQTNKTVLFASLAPCT